MKTIKFSVGLITLNEAQHLPQTLAAIQNIADEIVIVDSGSTDETCHIAKSFGATVLEEPWRGFTAQKNFLLEHCHGEWILCLDADEVVTPELARSIQKILETEGAATGYILKRYTVYMGRLMKFAFRDRKLRLVKAAFHPHFEGGIVHEKLVISGKMETLTGRLLHYSYQNFSDHLTRSIRYGQLGAEKKSQHSKAYACFHMVLNPSLAFIKSYVLKGGFLDGMRGFIVSVMRAIDVFIKYTFMYENRMDRKG